MMAGPVGALGVALFALSLASRAAETGLADDLRWRPLSLEAWDCVEDPNQRPGSIIKRFVDPLTRQENRPVRSLLSSDREHALSIAPVLTPNTPVYIRYCGRQAPGARDMNYVLLEGKVYACFESPLELEKTPVVRIRPIDGGCSVPFLIRVAPKLRGPALDNGVLEFLFRVPAIFDPRVEVRSVTFGNKKLDYRFSVSPDWDVISISVPVSKQEVETAAASGTELPPVLMDGLLVLNRYDVLPPDRFVNLPQDLERRFRSIARLMPGRDYLGEEEEKRIRAIVGEIQRQAQSSFHQLLLAHRVTAARIQYFNNNMLRTPMQILSEGIGDCDDYGRLMVCLLRGLGIPSRMAIGQLYDFNNMGAHAWVEAALPMRNGKLHWFLCDPTLAAASPDKDYFVQFKNRIYLCPLRFSVQQQNLPVDMETQVLLNWRTRSSEDRLPPAALQSTINSFGAELRKSLEDKTAAIRAAGLLLTREFMYTPGAAYVFTARIVTPQRSRFRVTLDSEERVAADLTVLDDDFELDSAADQQTLAMLKGAYQRLRADPLQSTDARHCLELTYFRDRHTDAFKECASR
jgi:transglutaminase-like putative cysteine protease